MLILKTDKGIRWYCRLCKFEMDVQPYTEEFFIAECPNYGDFEIEGHDSVYTQFRVPQSVTCSECHQSYRAHVEFLTDDKTWRCSKCRVGPVLLLAEDKGWMVREALRIFGRSTHTRSVVWGAGRPPGI